mgnify:CR=1 FL=1
MLQPKDIILITGAGSGMGKLAAERAANNGENVVGFDLDAKSLMNLESRYNNIKTFVVDITNYESVEKTIALIVKNQGNIKKVINCAGIMPLGTLSSQHPSEYKKIMDVNYLGTVNINMAVLANMRDNKHGEIVNFASIAGLTPSISFGAYCAAKFAVVAFSEVLHHENQGYGIKVCCVCPPPVNTPLLRGAINRPKSLELSPAVEPEFVLNVMEKSLAKGQWLCLPGWQAKVIYRARRFMPDILWRAIHLVEGKNFDHLSKPSSLHPKISTSSHKTPLKNVK